MRGTKGCHWSHKLSWIYTDHHTLTDTHTAQLVWDAKNASQTLNLAFVLVIHHVRGVIQVCCVRCAMLHRLYESRWWVLQLKIQFSILDTHSTASQELTIFVCVTHWFTVKNFSVSRIQYIVISKKWIQIFLFIKKNPSFNIWQ